MGEMTQRMPVVEGTPQSEIKPEETSMKKVEGTEQVSSSRIGEHKKWRKGAVLFLPSSFPFPFLFCTPFSFILPSLAAATEEPKMKEEPPKATAVHKTNTQFHMVKSGYIQRQGDER